MRVLRAGIGVTVTAVMTDNGSCSTARTRSPAALGDDVKHRFRTRRSYRPQTNGKVERFNRTLAAEWAYADVFTTATKPEPSDIPRPWVHHYNHPQSSHRHRGGRHPHRRTPFATIPAGRYFPAPSAALSLGRSPPRGRRGRRRRRRFRHPGSPPTPPRSRRTRPRRRGRGTARPGTYSRDGMST